MPPVTVAELDPENRVITKAIVDKSTELGLAGMKEPLGCFRGVLPKGGSDAIHPAFVSLCGEHISRN